jgi:type IV secretion system protein VirB3
MEVIVCKAATRPAMKWGVPLKPFMYTFLAGLLMGTWGTVLTGAPWCLPFVALVCASVLLWMRTVTRSDDQRLRQMKRAAWLAWQHRRALRLLGCRAYSPTTCLGASDAWLP